MGDRKKKSLKNFTKGTIRFLGLAEQLGVFKFFRLDLGKNVTGGDDGGQPKSTGMEIEPSTTKPGGGIE